jgi:uncharacterized protein (DUF4415 family)
VVNGLEITVIIPIPAHRKGASSQLGDQNHMKDALTGKTSKSKTKSRTDWNQLRQRSNAAIGKGIKSDPDAHATDESFWKSAKVVWPTRKEVVTMRLDTDLLEWFRRQRGYQTRINAILRTYMNAKATDDRLLRQK